MTPETGIESGIDTGRKPAFGAHHVEHVMGMPISIDIRDAPPSADSGWNEAIAVVIEWLHHVDSVWSTWRDDSVITRFARGELADLPESMHEVLDRCDEIADQTAGAFDIHVPAPNGTQLEPSGFIKGWSIQKAMTLLESFGVRNASIKAGGDIAGRGAALPNDTWKIGIRHPDIADAYCEILELQGCYAVATSATYERGQHIFDPRRMSPATACKSATVVGTDLAEVDAAATALFVMGVDGFDWIVNQGMHAMIIDNDGLIRSTPKWRDRTVLDGGSRCDTGLPWGLPDTGNSQPSRASANGKVL